MARSRRRCSPTTSRASGGGGGLRAFFPRAPPPARARARVGGPGGRTLPGGHPCFLAAGAPGLAPAALALRPSEPPRGAQDAVGAPPGGGPAVSPGRAARAAYGALLRNRPYILTVLGYAAYTFAIGALAFWTPAFLERARGIPKAQATVQFGAIVVVTGFLGTYGGGWLGDRLLRRSPRGDPSVGAGAAPAR